MELRRRRRMESELEQQQRMLESSYGTFCQLSEKDNIDNVLFANGKAILTLGDGRRYHFDATDRVARMYSVPQTGTFEAKETNFVRGLVRPGRSALMLGLVLAGTLSCSVSWSDQPVMSMPSNRCHITSRFCKAT